MLRRFISFALVLALVMTSQAMASAHSAARPAEKAVLCIGATAVVVYLDEQGNPTSAPHFCPDCTLLADLTPPQAIAAAGFTLISIALPNAVGPLNLPAGRLLLPEARAPPFLV